MACLALDGTVSAYATDDPAAVIPIPFVPAMQRGFNFRFMRETRAVRLRRWRRFAVGLGKKVAATSRLRKP